VEFVIDSKGAVQNARALRTRVDGAPPEASAPASATPSGEAMKLETFTVAADSPSSATVSGVRVDEAARLLGEAAVEAVSKWRFEAGVKNGRPVNTRMEMPIVFTLSKDE